MARRNHIELQELVAAYAIDALETDEVDAVEQHLTTCPKCRAELQDHRDTAGFLSYAGADAPAGLWEQIAGQLDAETADQARIFPFAMPKENKAKSVTRWRTSLLAAAAALVLTAGVGSMLIRQNDRINEIEPRNISQLAEQLASRSSSKVVGLRSADGTITADAVLGSNGTAYLLHTNMPKLNDDQTYQLWGIKFGQDPVSLKLLGSSPTVVGFSTKFELDQLAITVEPAGGSPSPSQASLLSGAVA